VEISDRLPGRCQSEDWSETAVPAESKKEANGHPYQKNVFLHSDDVN
jgi:hypothetical protein